MPRYVLKEVLVMGCTVLQIRYNLLSPRRDHERGEAMHQDQSIILFHSELDQISTETAELQSSLTEVGVCSRFEDPNLDALEVSSASKGLGNEIVQRSLFWEAPSRTLGSELLNTFRRFGWRPHYARSSGKLLCRVLQLFANHR
jgi:hypothetical protein